ncbi:MAG: hypothetical protein EBY21_04210 [Alphaproteobacteria bacterium]|nr:hypothetical protein [Alphaproteobacteria bacterium]
MQRRKRCDIALIDDDIAILKATDLSAQQIDLGIELASLLLNDSLQVLDFVTRHRDIPPTRIKIIIIT